MVRSQLTLGKEFTKAARATPATASVSPAPHLLNSARRVMVNLTLVQWEIPVVRSRSLYNFRGLFKDKINTRLETGWWKGPCKCSVLAYERPLEVTWDLAEA